jgi:hypothetical protein
MLFFQYLEVAQTIPDGVVLTVDVILLHVSLIMLLERKEETYVAQMVEVVCAVV